MSNCGIWECSDIILVRSITTKKRSDEAVDVSEMEDNVMMMKEEEVFVPEDAVPVPMNGNQKGLMCHF